MIGLLYRTLRSLFFRPPILQVGALCLRGEGAATEVLLIRSLDSNRWIIPKGWPMRGQSLAEAAAIEAWEEAGVRGTIADRPIGSYVYGKRRGSGVKQKCAVQVFVIEGVTLAKDYPEAAMRYRKWFPTALAAKKLGEPELKRLIEALSPEMR
ncbi:NUDIX domain-containing protein [Pseudorhodobacter sp. E13]|nr:NUDIX domain-containing protein [Pseudorhodobacter sp. E13]